MEGLQPGESVLRASGITKRFPGVVANDRIDIEIRAGEISYQGQTLRLAAVRDVTERKQAEAALLESEKRFRDVAENAQEWVWEVDAKGKYTYASPIVEKLLGYKPGEILNKYYYDLFIPEDRENLKQMAFEVFADAYYRYWDIGIFKQNTKASFYNALSVNWVNKQWPSSNRMIVAMLDLDILEENEQNRLVQMLGSWAEYFYRSQKKKECLEVAALWASIAPNDPQLRNFQNAMKSLK